MKYTFYVDNQLVDEYTTFEEAYNVATTEYQDSYRMITKTDFRFIIRASGEERFKTGHQLVDSEGKPFDTKHRVVVRVDAEHVVAHLSIDIRSACSIDLRTNKILETRMNIINDNYAIYAAFCDKYLKCTDYK